MTAFPTLQVDGPGTGPIVNTLPPAGQSDTSSSLSIVHAYDVNAAATFGVAASFAPVAAPQDVVVLTGSATKIVRVKRVAVSGFATAAGTLDLFLVKRTVADTAGTSTTPAIGSYDSADAAATAVLSQYSANPTLGAGVILKAQKLAMALAGVSSVVVWDFSIRRDKPPTLRGIAQQLAINLNAQALPAGSTIAYEVEWEESVN